MTPEKLKEAQVYVDFVKTNLEPLAEHLKVSVEWLWNILVNQVRVEAIVYLAIIILLTIKASVLLFIAFKSMKKAKFGKGSYSWVSENDRYTNTHGYITYWCGAIGAILMVVATITTVSLMPKIVTGLVNPEYGAIERIIQFSKGKVPEVSK